MDKPEVLVHISTPATRANDDLYRSLADAYLDFRPYHSKHSVLDDGALPDAAASRPDLPLSSDEQAHESDISVPAITSMDSYGSFPSHITSGNKSSDPEGSEVHESSDPVEDVSISRLERLERNYVMWKYQGAPKSSGNSLRQSTGVCNLPVNDNTFIEDTQLALQTVQSQLTDGFSAASQEVSDDEANLQSSHPPLFPSSGNLQAGSCSDLLLDGDQPRRRTSQEDVTKTRINIQSSQNSLTSANTNTKGASRIEHEENSSQGIEFGHLLSVVSPPAPKITMEAPGRLPSQVTGYLQALKLQNPERFRPKMMLRALEADERGHWRVDCRLWPKNAQHEFWERLQKDINNSRLGWGVTLHREATHFRRLGLVQLYCWGEIVEHVWLSLWIHSAGRICSTGSVWVDADEAEVITMC